MIDRAVAAELDTTDLHIEADQLFAQVGADAEAIDALIARNVCVSQDQTEYQRRFDKLNTEHARLLADYDKFLVQISDLENRQAAYRYYKEQLAPSTRLASSPPHTYGTPSSTTPKWAPTAPSRSRSGMARSKHSRSASSARLELPLLDQQAHQLLLAARNDLGSPHWFRQYLGRQSEHGHAFTRGEVLVLLHVEIEVLRP